MQLATAGTAFFAGFLREILVDCKEEGPEAGIARQIVIHGRVLHSVGKPWSTPLGELDPVVRLFEGNFVVRINEVAQE
ncbi:MAG: hypothetical protein WAK33_14835 [Silvibacterium sp.]